MTTTARASMTTIARAAIDQLSLEPGQTFDSQGNLERKYGLAPRQITHWRKEGKIADEYLQPERGPRNALIIDEYIIRQLANDPLFQRKNQPIARPAIVQASSASDPQPSVLSAPVYVMPNALQDAPTFALPQGNLDTLRDLVSVYKSQRQAEVTAERIKQKTVDTEYWYLKRFAIYAPTFPWSQLHCDQYLAAHAYSYHAKRYLKALTIWALDRWENAPIPKKIKVGKQKPPRHEPPDTALEKRVMAAILKYDPSLWVYAMVLTRTGCRAFELLDQDWETITPRGFQSQGRAKKKAGWVHFPTGLYEVILQLPEPHTGPLFPKLPNGHPNWKPEQRANAHDIYRRFQRAYQNANIALDGPKGSYVFRHLFAQRMKDRWTTTRLADFMRTSVEMIDYVYGKPSDESFQPLIDQAVQEVWGGI